MRYLIDTNIWIYLMNGLPEAENIVRRAARAKWCGYSAITRLDLFGFVKLTKEDEVELKTILGEFSVVDVSPNIIDEAIKVRKGINIKVPDAIIASTALVCNATLVTRDAAHFAKIKNLKILNPFD